VAEVPRRLRERAGPVTSWTSIGLTTRSTDVVDIGHLLPLLLTAGRCLRVAKYLTLQPGAPCASDRGFRERLDDHVPYADPEPARADVDAWPGATLLEFRAPWCGGCRSTQPAIAGALATHPDMRHVRIEDASGRPLGRSFGIKLWPTLIFLRDGREIDRLVRPRDRAAIETALKRLGAERCVATGFPSTEERG
jgi:thioredoxin 1